jgi:tryptophanyl-tRNA synthetase
MRGLAFDDPERPECQNLLTLYMLLSGQSKSQVAAECAEMGWGQFKPLLTEATIEALRSIQQKYRDLTEDRSYIKTVLQQGRDKAEAVAQQTLDAAKDALGFAKE